MGLQAVVMFSSSLAFIYTGYPETLANTFLTYVLVLYIVIVKLLLQLHQVRVDTCLQHNRGRTIMKIDIVKTRTTEGANQIRSGPVRTFTSIFPDTATETAIVKHMASNLPPSDFLPLEQFVVWTLYFVSLCCPACPFHWNARWVPQNVFNLELWGFENSPWRYLPFIIICIRNSRSYHQAGFGTWL